MEDEAEAQIETQTHFYEFQALISPVCLEQLVGVLTLSRRVVSVLQK